jgi:hypothetical protein
MGGHYVLNSLNHPSSNITCTKVFKDNKLEVVYESDTKTLVIKWEGNISSDEIKTGYYDVLQLVKQLKPQKWIIDLCEREQIRGDVQRWIFKNIFSEALKVLKCDIFIAVLLPVYYYQTLLNEVNGDDLIHDDSLLIINHFLYESEGRRWLENVTALN